MVPPRWRAQRKKLLPEALDALLAAVAPAAKPALVVLALNVAAALDLYDNAGGFSAHSAQLAAMTSAGLVRLPVRHNPHRVNHRRDSVFQRPHLAAERSAARGRSPPPATP